MAQCKTRADLHREYARVIDMCEGTELQPNECVKIAGIGTVTFKNPCFDNTPQVYRFALAIAEGKPVFLGDELYGKLDGKKHKIDGSFEFHSNYWSWEPPQPKKLVLNGVELPMPSFDYGKAGLVLHFDFKSEEDANEFKKLFFELITNQENVK